jgi:hypothetical protein
MKHGIFGLLLMIAISAEPKATSNTWTSLTICPPEATPTAAYTWVCGATVTTPIEAVSHGELIECFWTPRSCGEES